MTFRTRVIAATVLAAAIAVIVACFSSYLSTRDAIMHSVDASLIQASEQHYGDNDRVTGAYTEIVLPSGETIPSSSVPIDATIMSVAKGERPQLLRTVTIGGHSYRELIVPLAKGAAVNCTTGVCQLSTTSAELLIVNITGEVSELSELFTKLLLVAAGGLLIALGLGLFLARQALRPLETVTNEIEAVATTNNLGFRLDEGGEDELGRLRRTFNKLLGSVEHSQDLQRQLVLDASHELRTPLTSLRTNAQVISRSPQLNPEELHQITDDMVSQVEELASLVTDLAELARSERGAESSERLRLDDCVDECVAVARTHARLRDVTITVESEPSEINARHERVVRAVSNLLTNAVKFTSNGGHVAVTSRAGVVVVADDGPGINDEDRAHVFDRFWRSPGARALPGSGLGLSIVAQVAREFSGAITVDRDPELGGARFTLSFPLADEEDR